MEDFMKLLVLLMISCMFASCASQGRQIASQEEQALKQIERNGDFGPGYRY